MAKSKTNTQLDKAILVLKGLVVNITSDDRAEAEKKFDLHQVTISRYLKGTGTDLDTAMKLIDFFQKRIEDRERKLQGAA